MRKVHASTGCDAGSVCARRNNKPRDGVIRYGDWKG